MTPILQVFYCVFSGVLLSAAIPNDIYLLGCPVFSFFALIPYYMVIKSCRSFKSAFFLGYLQSMTTHFISSYWLIFFKDFAVFTLGGSAIGSCVTGAYFAVFMYLPFSRDKFHELDYYAPYRPFYKRSYFRVFYFAALYTLYEWGKSSGFLGYPWGTVSSTMYTFPIFMQIASITGTYGVTFLTVLFNAVVAEFFVVQRKNIHAPVKSILLRELNSATLVFLFLFVSSMIYGYYEYTKTRTPIKQLTTICVQQNSDPWKLSSDEETIRISQDLTQKKIDELKEQGKKPELIVWSEGSFIRHFPMSYSYYKYIPEDNPFVPFVFKNNTPLIGGGAVTEIIKLSEDHQIKKNFNAALVFDNNGNYRGYYGKLHLVPFAESIPFIDNPKIKNFIMKYVGISAGWNQGEHLTYFDIPCTQLDNTRSALLQNYDLSRPYLSDEFVSPTVKISVPICYDDAFTDVIRPMFLNGTELFVNITDDSWSLRDSAEYQHFCIAAYRPIEYRTTFIRSTNAGYSVILDPSGKILADEPLFEATSMAYDVPVYERQTTVYAKFGNWLPDLIWMLVIITSIVMFYDQKNKNSPF